MKTLSCQSVLAPARLLAYQASTTTAGHPHLLGMAVLVVLFPLFSLGIANARTDEKETRFGATTAIPDDDADAVPTGAGEEGASGSLISGCSISLEDRLARSKAVAAGC